MSIRSMAIAALATLGTAAAVHVSVYGNADCSGDELGSGSATSGECVTTDEGSVKVTCVSDISASAWTYTTYTNSACSGSAVGLSLSGNGTACTGSADEGYFQVDCGAGSCYSGNSFVVLQGGAKVHLHELNVGDKVLSADADGDLFYDKVFRITTWDDKVRASFVRLTTEDGNTLELTPNHFVHTGTLDVDSMALAGDVKVGDSLFTVTDGAVSSSPVAKIERVSGKGMYNVHTLSGRLVVNGVVGSHFTSETTWSQKSMAPYWYKAVDLVSAVFGAEDAKSNA